MTGAAPAASPDGVADLRLAGPSLACWAGAFVATWPAGLPGRGLVVVVGCLAALLCWAAVARRWLLVGVVVGLGAGLVMGTVRVAGAHDPWVSDRADEGATASVTAVVAADPVRRDGATHGSSQRGSDLVIVRVRMVALTARGQSLRCRLPLVVLALPGDAGAVRWLGLLPGQRLTVSGSLGPADPGGDAAALLVTHRAPTLSGKPSVVQRGAGRLRAGLRSAAAGLSDGPRGLLPGLVDGDTSGMPPDLVADFRTAGLTHLVAVSGANVAIVVGFVLLVGRWIGVRGSGLPLLGLLAMAGFVVLARPQPSVLRATAMGAVCLLALATGRKRLSMSALAAAVLVLVLVDPWLARSYGFVLSTLATGALVVLAPGWAAVIRSRGAPAAMATAVAVPLAAQAVCGPVVAMISGQVSLVAVPANLLAAPAVPPATVLGVLATVASVVNDDLSAALARVAGVAAWWIVAVAEHAGAAPMASVGWSTSVPAAAALALLTMGVVAAARRLAARPAWAASAVVLLVVGLCVPASTPGWPPAGWLVVACDVGQGDGLVLSAGRAGVVVVDAGPDARLIDRCLDRLGVRRVAMVVLTHFHADHVEGLRGVFAGRSVGEVVVGPYAEPAAETGRVAAWAAAARVPVRVALMGERVSLGPLSWRVLWPERVIENEGSAPNNASLVLLVRDAGVRILMTGDVEPAAQRALLARWRAGPVDILKVPHHGSGYQSRELLAAVHPRVALISVGADNDYGHPAPRTVRALRRLGALVLRTDRDGTVAVVGRGRRLRVVRGPG